MKSLKFKHNLVQKILSGEKTLTWRLFDDKDLQVGDAFELIISETKEKFAEGVITGIREKRLGEISEPDYLGHERFQDAAAMLAHYRTLYGDRVTMETPMKVVEFRLTSPVPESK